MAGGTTGSPSLLEHHQRLSSVTPGVTNQLQVSGSGTM
jgi:hypothetical protein